MLRLELVGAVRFERTTLCSQSRFGTFLHFGWIEGCGKKLKKKEMHQSSKPERIDNNSILRRLPTISPLDL